MTGKPRLSDRKHAAIIEAAVEEFDAQGFEATSMDSVAARAGVSKRTVYNHFASKETLFRQIRDELVRRAREVQPVPYDRRGCLREQLQEIGQREVDLLVSKDFVTLARVTIPTFLTCKSFASETFTELQGSHEGLVNWIRDAAADGRLAVEDIAVAARQFLVLLHGFAFWPQLVGGQPIPSPPQLKRIVSAAVGLFLDHYAAREPGAAK